MQRPPTKGATCLLGLEYPDMSGGSVNQVAWRLLFGAAAASLVLSHSALTGARPSDHLLWRCQPPRHRRRPVAPGSWLVAGLARAVCSSPRAARGG